MERFDKTYKVNLSTYEILTIIRVVKKRYWEHRRRSIMNMPKSQGDCDDQLEALYRIEAVLSKDALECEEIEGEEELRHLLSLDTLLKTEVTDTYYPKLNKNKPL